MAVAIPSRKSRSTEGQITMPLILQPATKENGLQRGEVLLVSNIHDPITKSFMPGLPYEVQVKFFGEATSKDLEKPEFRALEIIDTEANG